MSAASFRHVVKAEKTGDRDVTFTFEGTGNRELPQIVGQLIIVPKHWWEGTDKDGKQRNIAETTLEPPLGCGPYRIKEFAPGHHIIYERVARIIGARISTSISAATISTSCGLNIFAMSTVAIEAFKANNVDWRTENSSKNWATSYDFPAVTEKRVVLEEFPDQQYRADAGFRLQYPPRQVQGSRACAMPSTTRSISAR